MNKLIKAGDKTDAKGHTSKGAEITERARRKAAKSGTTVDSVAAELKNREHGNEKSSR